MERIMPQGAAEVSTTHPTDPYLLVLGCILLASGVTLLGERMAKTRKKPHTPADALLLVVSIGGLYSSTISGFRIASFWWLLIGIGILLASSLIWNTIRSNHWNHYYISIPMTFIGLSLIQWVAAGIEGL
jgi:hypothetical protein